MKTLATLSLGLIAMAGLCPQAYAAEHDYKFAPYLGIDLQHNSISYNDSYNAGGGVVLDGGEVLDDRLNGLNIHVGNRFHKNIGVELGYFRTENAGKDIAAGTTLGPGAVAAVPFASHVRLQGVTFDALGYLPVSNDNRFELIGTAGVSWTKAKADLVVPGFGSDSVKDSELGFRIGGGAQVNLTDRINTRALVRYQTADFKGVADNLVTYTLGMNYSF